MVLSEFQGLRLQDKIILASAVVLPWVAYWRGWIPLSLHRSILPWWRSRERSKELTPAPPPPKPVSASSVHMSWRVTPDVTDEHGRLYAGEMLKIIDVAAGVAARRHTDLNCVTISLDRVVLVREIRAGDVIHIDACINRAWGSSLEAGVRVLLEDLSTEALAYCCHAYLTFVALAPAPSSHSGPPPGLRLGNASSNAPKQRRRKAVVAPIQPQTLIEKKRYLFAGRRRIMRTSRPPEDFSGLRSVVSRMIPTYARRQWVSETGSPTTPESGVASPREYDLTPAEKRQARELRSLELELLADALEARDPHVRVDADATVRADVDVYGPDAPVVPLADIERVLEKRKKGRRPTWVELQPTSGSKRQGLSASSNLKHLQESPTDIVTFDSLTASPSDVFRPQKLRHDTSEPEPEIKFETPRTVRIQDTLACTLQIVMPQHANSVGVLFGGQLMEWMERTAVLAAQRLKRNCAWVTAGMDGLEFREAVATGEVLTFRAIVTSVWTSSIEVYVCSHADVRRAYPSPAEGLEPCPGPASRFTNEAFLTLVALTPTPPYAARPPDVQDNSERRRLSLLPTNTAPVKIGATVVQDEEDPVLAGVMERAENRRSERLEMRELLLRVYANSVD